MSAYSITLAAPDDVTAWWNAATRLAAAGIAAEDILWEIEGESGSLFARPAVPLPDVAPLSPTADFRRLAQFALCHRSAGRHALLYRLMLRLRNVPDLLENRADPELARAQGMAKAVGRDRHKMTAFVRFRETRTADGMPVFIAWFEPEHHILKLTAGFFTRRFSSQRFSILTPEASVHWDGTALHHARGARRADAPDTDRLEALWLTYYASIFNPARLKVSMMKSEMPVKYWKNLPEAALIPGLVRSAQARASAMVEAAPRPARAGARFTPPPLEGGLARCTACALHAQATQAVAGEGPHDAAVMIVGDQPGDEDDLVGRPFAGPAGKLLDAALQRLGVSRSALYLTHAVKHFSFTPRGKQRVHKRPTADHVEACRTWLAQEHRSVAPRVIVALGDTALLALTGQPGRLEALRGKLHTLPDGTLLVATEHPATLLSLKDAHSKRIAWSAFLDDLDRGFVAGGLVCRPGTQPPAA